MATDDRKLAQLTTQHMAQRRSIIEQLIRMLLLIWGDFDSAGRSDDAEGRAAASGTLVLTAARRSRLLARSYASQVLSEMDAGSAQLPRLEAYYPRSGASPMEVYRRPIEQFRHDRSRGNTVESANEAATRRLTQLATSDIVLANRDEIRRVYRASPRIIGYRRIIHPELSVSGTCGLCIVAANQFYSTDELSPLHGPSCQCDTLPITSEQDPGVRLNRKDLDRLYAAAGGSTAAEDLQNVRITITSHGELGPVLVKHGDNFRTAADAGRPEWVQPSLEVTRRYATESRERLVVLDAELAVLEAELVSDPTLASALDRKRRTIRFIQEHVIALDLASRAQ